MNTNPDDEDTRRNFIMPEDWMPLMGLKEDMPITERIPRRGKSWGIRMLIAAAIILTLGHGAQLVYMFSMMPFIVAFLVHLGMAMVLIDVSSRNLPRIALALPILFYGGYYAMYLHRETTLRRIEAEYREQNERSYAVLDLAGHDLVLDQHEQDFAVEHGLVSTYALPNQQYGSLNHPTRWSLASEDACANTTSGMQHIDELDSTNAWAGTGLPRHCMLVGHKAPQRPYFVARTQSRMQIVHGVRIDENVIVVEKDGAEVSRFVSIRTKDALADFPLTILPCVIPWRDRYGTCEHPFPRADRNLNALPESFGGERPTLASMLGLPDKGSTPSDHSR